MQQRRPNSVLTVLRAPRHSGRRLIVLIIGIVIIAMIASVVAVTVMREPPFADHPVIAAGHGLEPVDFADLAGWSADGASAALGAFLVSCRTLSTVDRNDPLARACAAADVLPADSGDAEARDFFEAVFRPYRVVLSEGDGLLTAYYEPVIEGSRTRTGRFSVPLLALPADHVTISDDTRPPGFDPGLSAARRTPEGLEPWPTRAEIDDGALEGIADPLVWVEDPVDAFFVHIQGSTRISLTESGTMRVGFAGRNGHPYTSVGSIMIERGIRPQGGYSMDGLRAFFRDEPELGRALMHENRSYIFFREIEGLEDEMGPIGAQGVPLTTQRSLAVDPDFHRLGTPVYIDALLPTGANHAREPFQRLMIAQDTGSAIKGAARGDLFWGTGPEAGSIAGGIKAPGTFYVFLPRRS